MKGVWLVLLTLALAWGLWSFLGESEEEAFEGLPADDAPEEAPVQAPGGPGVQLTTATLSVTVRTSHGEAPPESTAGYVFGAGERVRKVDDKGQVRFSDAPLGWVTVVAHAPGYEDGSIRKYLSAGVPVDLVIVLAHPDDAKRKRGRPAKEGGGSVGPEDDEPPDEDVSKDDDASKKDLPEQRPPLKRRGGGIFGR